MSAISAAPATGTAPDTIATGVSAVSNPTVRYAYSWPAVSRTVRAASALNIAHEAADWPLSTANTANGTQRIAITTTPTTARRPRTRDSRGLAPSGDSAGPATSPSNLCNAFYVDHRRHRPGFAPPLVIMSLIVRFSTRGQRRQPPVVDHGWG